MFIPAKIKLIEEVLLKVLEKVYVYGPDKVELVWRSDDIFFGVEIPEKREVIYNYIAEMTHVENEMSKMNLPETVPAVV